MAESFILHIATPEKLFYEDEVESLVITSTDGELGILPGHLSMVVALSIAPIQIREQGSDGWRVAAISGGFARIKGDEVVILADTAEWPEDIDDARALEAKRRAEDRMRIHESDIEYVRSRIALERALLRLSVKDFREQ
ncbi:ATP synthase epsilon chain [Clostridia bacterium]|nr:ATP synthase epsilon chain [Clostridia bacterium]